MLSSEEIYSMCSPTNQNMLIYLKCREKQKEMEDVSEGPRRCNLNIPEQSANKRRTSQI